MEKIDYDITNGGFLRDPEYSFDLFNFFKKYADQFGDAESVLVIISEEIPFGAVVSLNKKVNDISIDGKKVIIKYSATKYSNGKGKLTVLPTKQDVYSRLGFLMDRAVKEYADKI